MMIVLLLALSLRATVNANGGDGEGICPGRTSIDLTNTKRNGTGFFTESGQFFHTEIVWKMNGSWLGCMCDVEPFVLLCSPAAKKDSTKILEPEYLRNTSVEVPSIYTTNLSPKNDGYPVEPEDMFHVFVWDSCVDDWGDYYVRDFIAKTNDKLYLLKNSKLFVSARNATDESFLLNWRRYCLRPQTSTPHSPLGLSLLAYFYGIGPHVNLLCFIVTIFIYSVLPELRNIHGNTFRCYLFCLLITSMIARRVFFAERTIGSTCPIFGYAECFFNISGFLWSNVVSFDLWWTFGGYRSSRNSGNLHDRRRFIWYSIYAWVTATLIIATCIGLDYYLPYLASHSRETKCCSHRLDAIGFFVVALIFIILTCNSFFFISTSIRLVQHKRNTQRQLSHGDSQRHDENQASFSLCLKLFVIMGMNWSLVFIAFIPKIPDYFRLLLVTPYMFPGIPIFIIFICKKKIWQSLKIRFKCYRDSNDSVAARSDQVQTSRCFRSHNSAQTCV